MIRTTILVLSVLFSVIAQCQKGQGITMKIEELSEPEAHIKMQASDEIYENLILSGLSISRNKIEERNIDFPFGIIAQSKLPDSLVNFGYHSFFYGMYAAYAEHRPFVLSPDMIWLLISQGFSRHVNNNAEELRHYFVDFSGKLSLVVTTNSGQKLKNLDNRYWSEVFPQFSGQIAKHVGEDLVSVLSSDFSTSTVVEKVASEITIMDAMKSYFDYIVISIICGIPEITLHGSTEDWQKILDKTKQLEKYDLAWWTKELEPILEQFVKASQGSVDTGFWRNMFKYHKSEEYGNPKIIDGWILKFFPYGKYGERSNFKEIKITGNRIDNKLPDEIVKVDLKYIEMFPDGSSITTPLELWAGFLGLEQGKRDFALKPKIAWMIRVKDTSNVKLQDNWMTEGIKIRVKEIPANILVLNNIKSFEVEFIDEIIIPLQLYEIRIDKLKLSGKIKKSEIKKIRKKLPKYTELTINNTLIK